MQDHWGPLPLDKQGNPHSFSINDFLRCEVCSVSADVERLTLGMLGVYNKTSSDLKLGLCDLTDLPNYYRCVNLANSIYHSTHLTFHDLCLVKYEIWSQAVHRTTKIS